MSEKCLDNITNYANTENGVTLPNNLTAVYTFDYCKDAQTLSVYDMTNIAPSENIVELTLTVTDSGGQVSTTVAASDAVLDVSGLALGGVIRIDYKVVTDAARENQAPAVFIDVTQDEQTRGVSDPNRVPLREKTTQGGVFGAVLIYEHIQTTPASVWTIAHGFGVYRPATRLVFDSADNMLLTGWAPIDSNSFQISVGSTPKTGRAYFIFKKP